MARREVTRVGFSVSSASSAVGCDVSPVTLPCDLPPTKLGHPSKPPKRSQSVRVPGMFGMFLECLLDLGRLGIRHNGIENVPGYLRRVFWLA